MTLSSRFAALCTFVLTVGSCGISQTFSNPGRIPTIHDPATLVIGDFNGDGRPDIAWVDAVTLPHGLYILLAQPDGSYAPAPDIYFPTIAEFPEQCVTADLNLDHHLDLICTSVVANPFAASLLVYLGNGDGTFQAPLTTSVPFTYTAVLPLAIWSPGDLNGDGKPDILVNSGFLQVLLGDGMGHFQPPIQAQAGIDNPTPYPADVNGDGKTDLLFSDGPEVELGTGGGNFSFLYNYSVPTGNKANCRFHDIEGTGHLDAVCGYPHLNGFGGMDLAILHGNSDGSFNTAPISDISYGNPNSLYDGYGTFLYPEAVYDANGDGTPDVLAWSGDGMSMLLGQPGLQFTYPVHYDGSYAPPASDDPQYQFRVVDMNGDGIPDLVSSGPLGIYITYGNADGSFNTARAYEVADLINASAIADFNGDGIPDVASTGNTAMELSFGKGDGSFGPYTSMPGLPSGFDATRAGIVHGDFNGDGKRDLLTTASSPSLFFGNGDGTFQPLINASTATTAAFAMQGVTQAGVLDLNHDGRDDLVAVNQSGSAPVLEANLSNGDGTFMTVRTTMPDDMAANGSIYLSIPPLAFADFDGDGNLDAVYGTATHLYMIKGHGDGTFDTFGNSIVLPVIPGASHSTGSLATVTGDFDGDGIPDVAILVQYGASLSLPRTNNSAVWVFYGNGNGGFSTSVCAGNFDRAYTFMAASDLYHTGRADLVLGYASSYGSSSIQAAGDAAAVIDAQPGRTFLPPANYVAGSGLKSVVLADINKDGSPDILLPNGESAVTVLLNNGPGIDVPATFVASPEPSIVGQPYTLTFTLNPPPGVTLSGNATFYYDGTYPGIGVGVAMLSGNTASVTITPNQVGQIGTYPFTATYSGDGTYNPLSRSLVHTVVTGLATTTTLQSSPNPSNYGQLVTFTATVATDPVGTNVPTGSVTFAGDGTTLATVPLVNGVATYTTSTLAANDPGTNVQHQIIANYVPSGAFAASFANLFQMVNGVPSSITISATPTSGTTSTTYTITAHASSASSAFTTTPTGTVDFFLLLKPSTLGTRIGSATLVNGIATLTTTSLPAGTDTIGAIYPGDNIYTLAQSNAVQITVAAPTATVTSTVTPNPSLYGQPTTFTVHVTGANATGNPSGKATLLFCHGATEVLTLDSTGNATWIVPGANMVSEAVGSCPYTVSYSGDSTFPAATGGPFGYIVLPAASTTTLSVSPNPGYLQQPVTITVNVAGVQSPILDPNGHLIPPGAQTATGPVQIYSNGALVGTATLNASNTATLTTTALSPGTDILTATYPGDANLTGSTSTPVTEIIVLPDFTVAAPTPSISIVYLHKGSMQLSFTAINGFNGPVNIACTGTVPTWLSCEATPVTLPVNGNATGTLTLDTSGSPSFYGALTSPTTPVNPTLGSRIALALIAPLPLAAIFLLKRRRALSRLLTLTFVAIATTTLSSCSTHYPDGVTPGTYTLQLTATGTSANVTIPTSHTVNITLTVTP